MKAASRWEARFTQRPKLSGFITARMRNRDATPLPATLDRRRNACVLHVRDANGQALAYVYFEDEAGRRAAAKLLTHDEARRIATNIAKLPYLLQGGAKA